MKYRVDNPLDLKTGIVFKGFKMNIKYLLIAVTLGIYSMLEMAAYSQGTTPFIIGVKHKIQSSVLNEERTFIVELPESYNSGSKKYPLAVILDGEVSYHSHSGILKHMVQGGQIPEMLIVAITNVDRVRDFTPTNYLKNLNGSSAVENHKTSGGSAKFLEFIEKELLPEVEQNYRTNSFKMLIGISHGGLLVGSSYLSTNSSFSGYISMDPSFWWDDQFIIKQAQKTPLDQIRDKRLYVSTADKFENFDRIPHVFIANINSHEMFNSTLKNRGVSPSNIELEYFKEENHWTVALMSLYHGMKFIYNDLKMKNIRNSSIEEITEYYNENYNGAFLPPENEINSLGYRYLSENKKEDALRFFQLNTNNYPTSSNAFDSLGEIYMLMGDSKNAIKNYKRSLELDDRNDNARKMLLKLENH